MISILNEAANEDVEKDQPQFDDAQLFSFTGRGSRYGGGGRGGCGGRGGFKKVVGQFLEQMGINVDDVVQKFQEGGAGDWCKKDWSLQRAEIVEYPQEVLEAYPGQTLLPTIVFRNGTQWPWKAGCMLTLAQESEAGFENLPIEIINVPVTESVQGKSNIKLSVPLKIHEYAVASDVVHEIKVAMRGPGGFQFGNIVTLKLKIVMPPEYQDEVSVYKLALKLHQQGLGSFDECVEAVKSVKDTNYDEQAAIKVLAHNQTQRKN